MVCSGFNYILPYPYVQLFIELQSWEERTFFQPSTLFLPFHFASSKLQGLSMPVPRLCSPVFLLGLIHKQALQPGQGPAPGRSRLFLTKPVCKYHLQSYSQQKPPVYCILASGFLRSLDLICFLSNFITANQSFCSFPKRRALGNQAAASRRRVPPRLKISVITGVPTPPVSSSGVDAEI